MDSPWTASTDELLRLFKVNINTGLSPEQVDLHSERYGTNGLSTLATYFSDALLTTALHERNSRRTWHAPLGAHPRAI